MVDESTHLQGSEADLRKRVLICEDDPDTATMLRLMLERDGMAADVAHDAAQAKRMLGQHDYAAMTLDLGLSDQRGTSLIRELRSSKSTADLPIIVISADASEGYSELQGEGCVMADWISTHIEHNRIVTALKQAVLPIVVVSANGGQKRNELNGEAYSVIDWINKPIDHDRFDAAMKQAIAQAAGARAKVLHVEDDPDMYRMMNVIVGEFAEIDNAPTLAAARQMLKGKYYDLAILDVTLPDGSGMELLDELNGATPPVRVLVFSAHEISQGAFQQVGAALVKSRTDNAQLLATIKRMVGVE